jgi:pimeloyl-ACP methyl ester carboxylesterase
MPLAATILGDGQPIVLLPWFGHDGSAMARAFEPVFVPESPWQRIYLDPPGTGDSSPVEPSSDAVLDAVGETVRSIVGDDSYLLAGCSYGGYLAAALARRAPTQVSALLLVCTGTKLDPSTRNLGGVTPATPEPGWLDGVPVDLHGYFGRAIGCQTRAVADRIAATFAGSVPNDDRYLETLRSTGYELTRGHLTAPFGAPTLVLTGRNDQIAGYVDQFEDLARYPKASYVALNDAGHYLPFEQPERFTTLVGDWLKRVSSHST